MNVESSTFTTEKWCRRLFFYRSEPWQIWGMTKILVLAWSTGKVSCWSPGLVMALSASWIKGGSKGRWSLPHSAKLERNRNTLNTYAFVFMVIRIDRIDINILSLTHCMFLICLHRYKNVSICTCMFIYRHMKVPPSRFFIYIYICPMYSYVYVSVNAYVSLYLHWYTHTFVKLYHILIHYLLSSIHYTIMWANSPPPNVPCACCFALMKFRRNTCKLYGIWTYFRWTPFESLSFGGCFTAGVPPTIWQGWQIGPFGTVATETYWFPLLFFSTWWVKCLLW